MKNRVNKILLMEDEDITARRYISLFEKQGLSVIRAATGNEAVDIAFSGESIDLILADIDLGDGIDGTEAVSRILEKQTIPVVFISNYTSGEIIQKTEAIDSYGFVLKNGGDAVLIASVKIALRLFDAERTLYAQKDELEAVNEEMQAAMEEMEAINHELISTRDDLVKSESELNSLFNSLLVGVGILDNRTFTRVNSYICGMTGYDENELLGSSTRILYSSNGEFERVGKELYHMMERLGHGIIESVMRRKDGELFNVLLTVSPLYPDDAARGVCATITDITELKNSEKAIKQSEMKFKAVMEQSTLPMLLLDYDGTMVDGNQAWMKLWGVDKKDTIGRYNVLNDPMLCGVSTLLERAFSGEPVDFPEYLYERVISAEDMGRLWLTGRAYPLRESSGVVSNVVIVIEDITERKKAEEALRISEEKFRNIFNNMTIGYFRTGLDGALIEINPACLKIFGYSSVEEARTSLNNSTTGVYASKSDWSMVREKMLSGGEPFAGVVHLKRNNGSVFRGELNMRIVLSSQNVPLYIEGLVEDITEREKTQEMLIQSEKMITVAGLAAGMAHEINNPLGIIMQNAENALHRMLDELPGNIEAAAAAGTDLQKIRDYVKARRIDQYLAAIRDAGSRAAKIVSNMLKFSRGTESKFTYLNVNLIIDRALDLASNDYDIRKSYDFRNIKIIKNFGDLPDIPCSETQIEQVFLNLFKNSTRALFSGAAPAAEEKTIRISTSAEEGYVRIEIKDNGPGMDEPIRKRIFEPFFTAAGSNSGTGLGLSVSYYIIVTGHGGSITVESAPGAGTVFIITLPVQRRGL